MVLRDVTDTQIHRNKGNRKMSLRGFENIEDVVETTSTRYLNEPGEYTLKIEMCKHHESSNPTKPGQAFFIAELSVISSDNDNFRKGAKVSYTKELTRNPKNVEDVKKFMRAATNEPDFSNIDLTFVGAVCGPEQLISGREVHASVYLKPMSNGTQFAVADFNSVG